MEQTEEYLRLIQEARSGYWIPIGIVSAMFSAIILLLLYIWNKMLKDNNEKHASNSGLLKEVSNNQSELIKIVTMLEERSKSHKERLEKLEEG